MEQQDDASDMMNSRVHHLDDDEQLLDQGNNKKRHKLLVSIAEPPENGAMQENDEQSGESSQDENKDAGDEERSGDEYESMNQQQVGSGAEDDDDSQFSEGDEDGDDENSFSFIQEHLPEWHEDVLSFGVARRLNEMLISSPGDLTRIRAVMQQHSPAILDPLYFLNYEKQRQLDDDATNSYILTGAEYVNGWPVHISLESSAPMPVILYLLQLFPQQAHLEKRRPSLHWACRGVRNRMDMIAFFSARAPESVSQRDSQGKLPLHHFLWDCYGESSLDIFEFLIAKYPRAIRTRDCFGRYPLHYACDNDDMTLEMVKFLVADFPKALTVPDKSGYLPLHNMCRHTEKVGAPPECAEILDFIMTQYPESLKHASNCGQLALHIATEEGVACSMLKKMVRLYPQSLLTRDKEYTLPIQSAYSCTSDLPDEEEWLQEAIPILTPPSCSPMLFCCNQRCSLDLVKYIQEKLDPDCCTRFYPLVTNGGVPVEALPLHMACLSGNPELSVLQWLVENNPRAVSFKIQGLFYPLQCFFQSKRLPASEINVEAVEYMVNQYPAVIKERDYKGRLPIQVAATAGAPLSVIYHLLRMAPDDMANIFQHPTSSSSEVGAAAAVKKMKKKSAMVRGAAFEKKPVAAMDQKPASSIIDNGNMSVK